MKEKLLFLFKGKVIALFAVLSLLMYSCIEGYKDDEIWSSGVVNAMLDSPDADKVVITPSADGSRLKVEWPVVPGAGGYEFSLYIVDDPNNPVLVGEENQVIDGLVAEREMREDTYYRVAIKTLGNEKYNNTEADSPTVIEYDNLLPVTAIIPDGTNLTEYFNSNPIPASSEELCYELEAGGNYTMNGDISIGRTSVTFRGSKVQHPSLNITNGSCVNAGAGLKLKYFNIECNDFEGDVMQNAIILMDPEFDESYAETTSTSGYIVVPTTLPVAIQSCEIKNLKQYLFYDNGKQYGIGTFLIKDCIIGQNTNTFNAATIRFGRGMVKDLIFAESTFYNEVPSHGSNRIIQISSGHAGRVNPTQELWANGNMTFSQSTFYQFSKNAQSFNSNGAMGQRTDNVSLLNCVIVDSGGDGQFVRRIRRGNTNAIFTAANNSYWYDGKFPEGEVENNRDVSGTHIDSDPQISYLGNGKFTMNGSTQISRRVGDPRWLPAE